MREYQPGPWRRGFHRLLQILDGIRLVSLNLLFLLGLVVAALFWLGRPALLPAPSPEGAALVIAPVGHIVDQRTYEPPLARLLGASELEPETLLTDITDTLYAAAQDPRLAAVVLDLRYTGQIGLSKAGEILDALRAFQATERPVYAFAEYLPQDHYLIAAQADQLVLDPMGAIEVSGFAVYRNYFRSLLEQLQIDVHIFRVGQYKSAVEPLLLDEMSEADRQANQAWLNRLWGHYQAQLQQGRALPEESLQTWTERLDQLLDSQQGDLAALAQHWGLVDQLADRREFESMLREQVGSDDSDEGYRHLYMEDYLAQLPVTTSHDAEGIAVITARGMIVEGEQPAGTVGADTLIALIEQARQDESIKALVLRVDSEGGSAFASEQIRRALRAFQDSGRPWVVSMGSIAASGGYWIAAEADQIWATPATLTGSIGIFGIMPNFSRVLENWGVHTDGVATSPLAEAYRVDRPLSTAAQRVIQLQVDKGYQRFVELVARGRSLSPAQVEAVAQGRVWSGEQALELGLVDQLGGLEAAITAAAELAQLTDYDVWYLEPWLSPQEQMLEQLLGGYAQRFGTASLAPRLQGPLAPIWSSWQKRFQQLQRFNDPQGLYLFCEGCTAP